MCVKFLCRCRIIDLEERSSHFSKVGSPAYAIPSRCLFLPGFFFFQFIMTQTLQLPMAIFSATYSLESSPAHSIQSQLFLLQFKYQVLAFKMENIILFLLMYLETAVISPLSLFLFPNSLILLMREYLLSRSIPEKTTHRFFPLLLIGMLNYSNHVNYLPISVIEVNSIFEVYSVYFSRTFKMLILSSKVPSFGFSADSIAS